MAGVPGLAWPLVLAAMVATVALWRPRPEALAALLLVAGVELLLPVHTGGGRYNDWLLHYEISLHYAGLPTPVDPGFLSARTPLFHQLAGAVLALRADYWVFQLVAVFLNSLWLWPAGLLLGERGGGRARLLAVALSPFLLAYGVYTWPWAFAGFFILAATYLAGRPGRMAWAGTGVAIGAAFLAHSATAGYGLGLTAFFAARERDRLLPALGMGALTAATQLPWTFAITGGAGPLGVLLAVDPVVQRVPVDVWLLTRLLVVAHSLIPTPPLLRGWEVPDTVIVVFVLSLPGALMGLLLVARRWLRRPGPLPWMLAFGAGLGLLAYPPQQFLSGMLDALFPGVLLLTVAVVAAIPDSIVRRLLTVQAGLAALFLAALALVSALPSGADPNVALKLGYGARFAVEALTPVPGVGLLALAAVTGFIALRPAPSSPPSAGSSP